MSDNNDVQATIEQLWIYPVKSCAGVRLEEAELTDTGLLYDRAWMVVDERGEFVTQRELPRMALIQPSFKMGQLVLRAPGMLSLHLALDAAEDPATVRVWNDTVEAYDMGDIAAQWFSDFLGPDAPESLKRLRLARFDPEVRRPSDPKWTGGREAGTQFADGFAVLLTSAASLDELNARLVGDGHAPVDQRRVRPNIVLGGLQSHDEDRVGALTITTDDGPAVIEPVKPCARCSIPDVDPDSALPGHVVGDTLRGYRADARVGGAITFGMNAIVLEGDGRTLRVGQRVSADWRFD
ncbi:MAG: MOSC domain-containing protein [Hydrogenophaga sp.]|uniref:MOSC domain-containing protein n=1 Tax=Hydrogenophaga sp. TaxID=1904254 RepID=UPI001694D2EA|nr:MOSC N-terminal beta barrel domain-containing protein [Hydrogenophaga sp.]NIM43151.1 MOSC domain-containing protein [Hydrogenophaga sp.]NIN28219.1 MOSC domain-containing protein [Hydrogenophaga sp.]NIN30657.1 MOSC domain-containing protein [Hydrogenophaga sp.]NIN57354.1 MOSC domain-containing protein [Hydrogenophaga sp.]NIO51573.1 MOSC domain-containing protein [Hydrogenophaga sp.]